MKRYKSFFEHHPVFRIGEFKAYLKMQGVHIQDDSVRKTIAYYCKKKYLLSIRNGFYAVQPEFSMLQSQDVSSFLVAGKATEDSVIAYHSALELHGLAYTHFNRHVFLSDRSRIGFDFQGIDYSSVRNPMKGKFEYPHDFGVEPVVIDGVKINRTNLERTVVDVLDRPSLSGGWEEVWRSLEQVIRFDAEFCVQYALALGKASLIAKLGYFFEQRPLHLSVDPQLIERLLPYVPKHWHYMDRGLLKRNRVHIKRWSLVVPRYLHFREWEEPFYDADI